MRLGTGNGYGVTDQWPETDLLSGPLVFTSMQKDLPTSMMSPSRISQNQVIENIVG